MARQITIDPVTRIEGHAKITVHQNDDGSVADAQFHVTQFRGFEKFCEGRPFYEMPSLTARICGICPVSHLLASAKACDALLAVRIPETAANLRRILNFGQIVQSHALSFFHLSSPDLLLGYGSDPAERNILGVLKQHPDLARDGVRLRKYGQSIIERLGGKRVHPAWVVPGGVNEPLSTDNRDAILAGMPEAMEIIHRTLKWYKQTIDEYRDEIRTFGNFPSMFMGIVHDDGTIAHYDGKMRFTDASGNIVADMVEPADYLDVIDEHVEPWSYLKFPYYKPHGYPEGMYRVGPLARLNIIEKLGTPEADQEWAEYRELQRGAVLSSFHYHYARLIEILYALERMQQLLKDPAILDPFVRAKAEPNAFEGVGVSEAPRGTLMHHYRIDEQGLMEWSNMIIATGHNNIAMNRGVKQVAEHYIDGEEIPEEMLNRVEAVIRCFDPCLSCSTHAVGQMPLHLQLVNPAGQVVDELKR